MTDIREYPCALKSISQKEKNYWHLQTSFVNIRIYVLLKNFLSFIISLEQQIYFMLDKIFKLNNCIDNTFMFLWKEQKTIIAWKWITCVIYDSWIVAFGKDTASFKVLRCTWICIIFHETSSLYLLTRYVEITTIFKIINPAPIFFGFNFIAFFSISISFVFNKLFQWTIIPTESKSALCFCIYYY